MGLIEGDWPERGGRRGGKSETPSQRSLVAKRPKPHPALSLPTRHKTESTLERLATNNHTRLWLIAAGAACVLIGLFPASSGWGHPGRRHPYLE